MQLGHQNDVMRRISAGETGQGGRQLIAQHKDQIANCCHWKSRIIGFGRAYVSSDHCIRGGRKKASKNFFFEKKKQKTFAIGTAGISRPEANWQKFFGYFFSKK